MLLNVFHIFQFQSTELLQQGKVLQPNMNPTEII